MNQFSDDDERIGHQRMLDNIRAEQVRTEPEPDHTPSSNDIHVFGQLAPIGSYWCCDWHRLHAEVTK